MTTTRLEKDLIGTREVPYEAYYGIQTLRAYENFKNISKLTIKNFPSYVKALAMVKWATAKANEEMNNLDTTIAKGITQACEEIIAGKLHDNFIIDMIQGGAGTSTNMNINEVVANRALEIMGYKKGEYKHCHPNNHVNLSQSTNDAYPTAIKIALILMNKDLSEHLKNLVTSFKKKGDEFADIIKMGRTQLQDAVPMTLGMEFHAFASNLENELVMLEKNADLFLEVNMGATAIGTGINTEEGYATTVIKYLREITGMEIRLSNNLIEATPDTSSFVMYMSALKRMAIKTSKICNDLRLLSSGPRCGLGEISLPKVQPGSSIMPGKVNPVIPEVMNQICYKVIGADLTVTMASEAGQLQLNVMEPIIAYSIFSSVKQMSRGMDILEEVCIRGILANREHCESLVKNSIGLVTALNPKLGYEASSRVAKKALEENKSVYDIVLAENLLSKKELDELLLPSNMLEPAKSKK